MKQLVEGEFYGLRENGHSEPGIVFQKPMKLPASIDSSDFRPGVQSHLNDRQTLRFFKKQEFDPNTNSTVMSQLITNRYQLYYQEVAKLPSKPHEVHNPYIIKHCFG